MTWVRYKPIDLRFSDEDEADLFLRGLARATAGKLALVKPVRGKSLENARLSTKADWDRFDGGVADGAAYAVDRIGKGAATKPAAFDKRGNLVSEAEYPAGYFLRIAIARNASDFDGAITAALRSSGQIVTAAEAGRA